MTDYTRNRNILTPVQTKPEPAAAPRPERRQWNVFHYAAIVCLLIVIIGCPVGVIVALSRSQPAPVGAVVGASGVTREVSIRQNVVDTSTPEPSTTPMPTRTPYPTITHTATAQKEHTAVFPTHTPLVVTVVVERVITTTPLPTYTQQPDPTPTAIPAWLAMKNHNAEIAMRRDALKMSIAEWFLHPVAITVYAVGVFVLLMRSWASKAPTVEGTEETAEEIAERVPPPINDWQDVLRRQKIERLYRQGATQRQIEQTVFGYTGGDAYVKVKAVIDELTTPPPPVEYHGEGVA